MPKSLGLYEKRCHHHQELTRTKLLEKKTRPEKTLKAEKLTEQGIEKRSKKFAQRG
jgi:hypothetical protein